MPERQNRGGRPVSTASEATWLVGLFLVPIAFSGPDMVVLFLQPKDFILHFTALLIVSLWGVDWAIGVYRQRSDFGAIPGIRRWPGLNPGRWALTAAAGYGLAVIATGARYRSAARYDDLLTIRTWLREVRKTRLRLEYEILLEGKTVVNGFTVLAFLDLNSGMKPTRCPPDVEELALKGLEPNRIPNSK